MNDDANENNDAGNYRISRSKRAISKSFQYKTKITLSTPDDNSRLEEEVDLPFINCEIELNLSRS